MKQFASILAGIFAFSTCAEGKTTTVGLNEYGKVDYDLYAGSNEILEFVTDSVDGFGKTNLWKAEIQAEN